MMNRYWGKNFNFHIHYLHVITSVGGGLVRFSFYWRQKLTDIHNTVFILYTTKKTNTKTGEVRRLTIKVCVANLYAFKPDIPEKYFALVAILIFFFSEGHN